MSNLMERSELARAITLVESRRGSDFNAKYELVAEARKNAGSSIRIAITGPPGVGKSTLIEKLGLEFIERGHRVAVLAIDPSSPASGGSILGDKTRMEALASNPSAFVRPTPSASQAGGVSEFTRETISLCEAGGYDIILVETVGVGQGEYAVHGMTDLVVLVTIPGAGDSLQGIKRGIMETADLIVINKTDNNSTAAIRSSLSDVRSALRIARSTDDMPGIVSASGKTGDGIESLIVAVREHVDSDRQSGRFETRRRAQEVNWFTDAISSRLKQVIGDEKQLQVAHNQLRSLVEKGDLDPVSAASLYVSAILRHKFD